MNDQNRNRKNETQNSKEPLFYVGIGASAGGLEALESFFTQMPSKSGLAFVVIQHLSPDYKSMMVELLSKRTEMPVYRAEEGMRVNPDTIYLIPPKKNLTIFHGKLLLNDYDHSKGLNLPIDIFLCSLAEDQGEKSIGVILSGTGSDGMRGIRKIKESGGMVIVQDEESAKFDGMPRSAISTGLADFILPPSDMPKQLLAFVKHPHSARTELIDSLLTNEDGLNRIFAVLREKTKVDFTFYKPSTVVRRIERRMTINQINELRDYVHFIESNPREATTLYREMLIGVTNFFRDPELFEVLLENWLPKLLAPEEQREHRFWVAGCSTGEEAYSLAIYCQECMERLGKTHDIKIFATDVDGDAIMKAGIGSFPESIVSDVSPRLLSKYFIRKEDNFQIVRSIREMVVFAQHNLIKDPPFTNINLVSCRNLLIYLQPVLQVKALEMFNFSLNPDGLLILGTSETIGEMTDYYEPVHHKLKIYRLKGKRKHLTNTPEFQVSEKARNPLYRPARIYGQYQRSQEEERVLERFIQAMSDDYFPAALIVNEQLELLHAFGNVNELLCIPTGKMINDITKMASKDIAIPLSTGIQKVLKQQVEIKYSNIRVQRDDKSQTIHMRMKPLPVKKGRDLLIAIIFEIHEKSVTPFTDNEHDTYDITQEAEQRIQDLEQELQFTRENLQATIEELETANEELQATNQELLSSNEELQSTNEELQSVNEELYTVNAEHQRKIIELTELNNDMDNLQASTQIGTIFLDENLNVRKFTPLIPNLFKIIDNDIGRPFHHLSHNLRCGNLVVMINQVLRSNLSVERELQTNEDDWYLLRILPYHISPEVFSGVILTFINITQLKKTQHELKRLEWQLTKNVSSEGAHIEIKEQPYGDLAALNTNRLIYDGVGENVLKDIVKDIHDLLETSAAIYESNGDYALGIMSSGWCRLLDNQSRNLCKTSDNAAALASGNWHCHESCWSDASKIAIETGNEVDIECRGGLRIYALPIFAGEKAIGSINFGYGDPPKDESKLQEIAERYQLSIHELKERAHKYESRSKFIIDIAKQRLHTSAKLIGALVVSKQIAGSNSSTHDFYNPGSSQ